MAVSNSDHELEFAKWLALLCMVADHIAWTLAPPWLDIGILLGQLSLPLYAFLIVVRLQSDGQARASRYLLRLLVWGVLTQPIYAWLLSGWHVLRLNAMFTLAAGVGLIYLAQTGKHWLVILATALLVLGRTWLDGGAWMPVAQVLAWYWLKRKPGELGVAIDIVAVVAWAMNALVYGPFSWNALFSLAMLPLVLMLSARLSQYLVRLPGKLFYAFYPAHLALILAIHGPY